MKSWIVRFASLYVFNVVVLLLIGLLTPARVGWNVIWAAIVMTLAELFVKPLVLRMFSSSAVKTANQRTKAGEGVVQALIVLAVAAIVWVITLLLSGVSAGGSWFWAWVLPPVIIAIGWFIYSKIDDKVEARTGSLYDQAESGIRGGKADAPPVAPTTPEARSAQQELKDGLTAEQRRMLDELGNG